MDLSFIGTLSVIGFVSGFMAGLAGIGGAVVVLPALVYAAGIPIKIATGISMVQAFFAALSAMSVHYRYHTIDFRLGLILGVSAMVGALFGAFSSAALPGRSLLWLYAVLLVLGISMLLFAPRQGRPDAAGAKPWQAAVAGMGVGTATGLLGVGGGWLLLPIMITLLRVPLKTAVGTSLMAILMSTFAGTAGKMATDQFDLQIGLPVIVSGIIGAQLGGRASVKAPTWLIRASLVLLLSVIAARTGLDLFGVDFGGGTPLPSH